MLRREFDAECTKVRKSYDPSEVSDRHFEILQYVYTWYPTIAGGQVGHHQIAYLFITFGWAMIDDMYARAKEAEIIDTKIRQNKSDMQLLLQQQAMLGSGKCWRARVDTFEYPTLENSQ